MHRLMNLRQVGVKMCFISCRLLYWNHLGNCKKKPGCLGSSSGESDLIELECSLSIRIFKGSLGDSNLQLRLEIKDVCEGRSFWMIKRNIINKSVPLVYQSVGIWCMGGPG